MTISGEVALCVGGRRMEALFMNQFITAAQLTSSRPKRSKFGVDISDAGKARRTRGGTRYGSQLECLASAYLEILHPVGLQKQVPFELKVGGRKVAKYVADFVAGDTVYEAKGKLMADARIKLNLFKALYPERKLFLVTKGTGTSNPLKIEEWGAK